jgi:Taurine catabolism dioxygenase TauD, TfdA family
MCGKGLRDWKVSQPRTVGFSRCRPNSTRPYRNRVLVIRLNFHRFPTQFFRKNKVRVIVQTWWPFSLGQLPPDWSARPDYIEIRCAPGCLIVPHVPSDYAILQIHTVPESGGGDTLWASAYEAYDRLSEHYKKFLEGLTAVHDGTLFKKIMESRGQKVRAERGAPENYGEDNLVNIHPLIRTNPVTGWKGLFIASSPGYVYFVYNANRRVTNRIVELTKDESDQVLKYLFTLIAQNHDLQVRFKWNKNDVAIWDNRSSYHTFR